MKKLFPYFRPYALQCILAPLFKLFEVLLELRIPLIIADIVDSGIRNADSSFILRRSLMLILSPLLGFLCAGIAQYFAANTSAEIAADVRRSVFSHIQTLSVSSIDSFGSSTLLTRMSSDMTALQQGINMGLRLLLRSPFVVFGAMIMAFTIDTSSALLFTVVIPLLAVIAFAIIIAGMPLIREASRRLDGLTVRTRDDLNGVRVIRAFGCEESSEREFEDSTSLLMEAQLMSGRISSVLNPLTAVTVNICIAVLVWQGALKVDSGSLTQGQVLALYNYMSQILVELVKLANLVITLSKAGAAGSRISAVLETPSAPAPDRSLPGLRDGSSVAFSNVSFAYPGSTENVLHDINLTVMPGSTVGIIGGTGCGKTTLVNLIPGLLFPSSGSVYVNGKDTVSLTPDELLSSVSIVHQKATLFSGTIRSNLLMGAPDASSSDIDEALRASCASDVVDAKPLGLDEPVEQKGRNFSGGQKQRLTIARSLVSRPSVLILDDSSSALDAATDARLRRNLSSLSWTPTVFIVSQRVASVKDADIILVMDEGRIAGCGTHAQLLDSCPEYREIVLSQTSGEVTA